MEIEGQGVQVESPATEEETVVNEEVTSTEGETTTPETEGNEEQAPPQGNVDFEALDESGVPWKNRAAEWQRKAQELSEGLPKLVAEEVTKLNSQQAQPQYTIGQLETYAQEHPEYRGWVEEEKARITQRELAKLVDEKLNTEKRQKEVESIRKSAYQYVNDNYPECFAKDGSGRVVWNVQSPMVQMIGSIMQDKRIADTPEGLMVASDIAYARLARANYLKAKNAVTTAKSQLKKEQRKNMVDSGTQTVTQPSSVNNAINRLSQTGSKKDAVLAMREILKASGRIKE